jgi:cytochrome c oxidase assembly protein subunit 11|tara:strand:+ start:1122 stop:1658 length:537 start_codon:yes stop_codon:yes gene_type:complete
MQAPENKKTKNLVKKLSLIVIAMFGFGFALVPLYDVFCDITGLNGKTANEAAQANAGGVDVTREIKVQLISHNAKDMPWQFRPEVAELTVRPGETKVVKFYAKNETSLKMVGQAVPSVAPGRAASHFKKIECFCFEQQTLEAQEEVWMPLQFYIDTEIPADVTTLTLSYTLFDVTTKI